MPTGLVYHPIFLEHDTGRMHPECPERLRAILKRLDADGLRQELAAIPPREAERVWLERVHTPRHLRDLRDGVAMAGERLCYLDHETPVSSASESAALSAAGGALAAVDAVLDGSVDNAFCLVRPPGHHAEPDRIMGFCLLNSVAIAARYLQHRHGIRRVLIVDWDVHHGNGTQAAFWTDPSVFYYSIHQYPFYPGSGGPMEVGGGEGGGTTLNSPMDRGCGDGDYLDELEKVLLPAAEAFRPEFVLVSAGFDAHAADPLGDMRMTADGFRRITELVRGLAESTCGGRLVSVLEGGYDLEALGASAAAHVRGLLK
ncbi:MAG: histone deacetylase [Nitrospirota bacterium]|nr:histone deacetylase [Nitrospirota bacterium]